MRYGLPETGLVAVALELQFAAPKTVAAAGFLSPTAGNSYPYHPIDFKSSTYASFIFTGAAVTGPNKTTYDVSKAPLAPGTYFFRCDYHPTSMFGQLVVLKGK